MKLTSAIDAVVDCHPSELPPDQNSSRRDPDAAGFNYWLTKLDTANGNYRSAEMVKAFLSSDEYRKRFERW